MRWYLSPLRSFLKTLLSWVERRQDRSPRRDSASLLAREVHVPTPLVTAASAAVLFFVLLPETGLAEARGPLDKIRKALAALDGAPCISIGARSYVQTPQSMDQMLRETEDKVKSAKSSGKSRTEHD